MMGRQLVVEPEGPPPKRTKENEDDEEDKDEDDEVWDDNDVDEGEDSDYDSGEDKRIVAADKEKEKEEEQEAETKEKKENPASKAADTSDSDTPDPAFKLIEFIPELDYDDYENMFRTTWRHRGLQLRPEQYQMWVVEFGDKRFRIFQEMYEDTPSGTIWMYNKDDQPRTAKLFALIADGWESFAKYEKTIKSRAERNAYYDTCDRLYSWWYSARDAGLWDSD
eukprot:TRINITY_DN1568_c1_g4_i1.p1 TRINITY_DN1568_c1_g4~~TRINITY_DN1568_c1_g4_i1.p1  ORF type:complete len:257 (+),score=55.72 TRINITY_DN1568_c1_g4_i1:105-773(+)